MPREARAKPPEKLSLVVFSGDYDKVHYALSMASAALAVNRPATLFFTMEAIRGLAKPGPDGGPGWGALRCGDGGSGAARDRDYRERGVATFEELMDACVELGARFMVCEMGLRALRLTAADLRDDIGFSQGGLVTFLNDASADGAVVFI